MGLFFSINWNELHLIYMSDAFIIGDTLPKPFLMVGPPGRDPWNIVCDGDLLRNGQMGILVLSV